MDILKLPVGAGKLIDSPRKISLDGTPGEADPVPHFEHDAHLAGSGELLVDEFIPLPERIAFQEHEGDAAFGFEEKQPDEKYGCYRKEPPEYRPRMARRIFAAQHDSLHDRPPA